MMKRYKPKLRITSKRKFMVLVLLFLLLLVWSFLNYIDIVVHKSSHKSHASIYSEELPNYKPNSQRKKDNAAGLASMLKGINSTLIKIITNYFHAAKISAGNTVVTKPSIDLVNDYYPFVDFKFVFPQILPRSRVDTIPNIFMIVLVNSGAKGDRFRKNREAIRQTWGNQTNCEQRKALGDENLKDLRWLLVFVVGKAGPGTNDDELNMAEARQHNDMLIGNITDNYINNIIKLYMGLLWASRFEIKYVLKTDDDVYVRIPRVLEYLVNATFPRPFCGGVTFRRPWVKREVGNKWTISCKYYGKAHYPDYSPGAFVILSSDLLNRLFNYVYIRKPFHVDDAYIGVAMHDFGVKITTMISFVVDANVKKVIREADDCKLLGLIAIGHNIDLGFGRYLHNRVEKLACKHTQIKC